MHDRNLFTQGLKWELPMKKCMVKVFNKLAELPITITQHNFLVFCITVMTAGPQKLNLVPTINHKYKQMLLSKGHIQCKGM